MKSLDKNGNNHQMVHEPASQSKFKMKLKELEQFEDIDKIPITLKPGLSFTYKLMQFLGPGFLMSMAQLDPGNISGNMKAGIDGRYSLLYILLLSTVFGGIFQCVAAKIGVVTRKDLAQNIYLNQPPGKKYFLWIMCEIAIIGSDVQEVIGSSIALHIIFGMPLYIGVLLTIFDTFIIMSINQFGSRFLELFFAMILAIMIGTFWTSLIRSNPDWDAILIGTFTPTINEDVSDALLGIVGAIIMPHNFYLHSALVLNRDLEERSDENIDEMCLLNQIESGLSLFISFVINLGIIALFGQFQGMGKIDASIYGFEGAAHQLESNFGHYYKYLWGVGLLAAGQAATMTGTYAGQQAMQGFLNLKMAMWKRTLLTRSIAIIPSLLLLTTDSQDSINDNLNILQAIQLPFAILPLIAISTNREIMGKFAIGFQYQVMLWFVGLTLLVLNIQDMYPVNAKGTDQGRLGYFIFGILVQFASIFWVLNTTLDVDEGQGYKEIVEEL